MGCHHLENTEIWGPDTTNHNDKHSIEFLMVRNHKIDTKFAFLAHLVQKLQLKTLFWPPYWISRSKLTSTFLYALILLGHRYNLWQSFFITWQIKKSKEMGGLPLATILETCKSRVQTHPIINIRILLSFWWSETMKEIPNQASISSSSGSKVIAKPIF